MIVNVYLFGLFVEMNFIGGLDIFPVHIAGKSSWQNLIGSEIPDWKLICSPFSRRVKLMHGIIICQQENFPLPYVFTFFLIRLPWK